MIFNDDINNTPSDTTKRTWFLFGVWLATTMALFIIPWFLLAYTMLRPPWWISYLLDIYRVVTATFLGGGTLYAAKRGIQAYTATRMPVHPVNVTMSDDQIHKNYDYLTKDSVQQK